MKQSFDIDRVLQVWMADGPAAIPDRVVDVVANRIGVQRQRRPWPFPGRTKVTTQFKLIAALAAALVVAVLGYNLLPRQPGVGGPTTAPTPTATPVQSPTGGIVDVPEGESTTLSPGVTYRFHPFDDVTILAPGRAGWSSLESFGMAQIGRSAPTDVAVVFLKADHGLYSDPCHWDLDGSGTWEQDGDVEVGPTVQDLVDAFRANAAYTSTEPSSVTFGPYQGQELEIQFPADLNLEICDVDPEGEPRYRPAPDTIYAQGDGNRWRMSIVDVAGTRVIATILHYPGTPAADLEAAQAVIDSLAFEP
jgi:hypothetical protein